MFVLTDQGRKCCHHLKQPRTMLPQNWLPPGNWWWNHPTGALAAVSCGTLPRLWNNILREISAMSDFLFVCSSWIAIWSHSRWTWQSHWIYNQWKVSLWTAACPHFRHFLCFICGLCVDCRPKKYRSAPKSLHVAVRKNELERLLLLLGKRNNFVQ